ncbi:MAG: hypothetical protein LH647_10700 [Leptolyngbyaceae cyanobacterium CAN_BIN12]|nr:hypothetical protein [Leptolyngbyaceae cyanobacterium CAN_BIN12]
MPMLHFCGDQVMDQCLATVLRKLAAENTTVIEDHPGRVISSGFTH